VQRFFFLPGETAWADDGSRPRLRNRQGMRRPTADSRRQTPTGNGHGGGGSAQCTRNAQAAQGKTQQDKGQARVPERLARAGAAHTVTVHHAHTQARRYFGQRCFHYCHARPGQGRQGRASSALVIRPPSSAAPALPVVLLPVHRLSGFSLCSIAFSLQLHALV
jgi:hypothetical protein